MNITISKNSIDQVDQLIHNISSAITNILKQKNHATLAVSGGKSPIALFNKLSAIDLPWDKIIITLVDERVVDITNTDSNENLVKTHLLKSKAAKANFMGLHNAQLNEIPKIDIAILGMGEDGHTASIFPSCKDLSAAIDLNTKNQYITTNPTTAKYQRISLTLKALTAIPYLILAINGDIKLNILNEAMLKPNTNYPISFLLHHRPDLAIFWYQE